MSCDEPTDKLASVAGQPASQHRCRATSQMSAVLRSDIETLACCRRLCVLKLAQRIEISLSKIHRSNERRAGDKHPHSNARASCVLARSNAACFFARQKSS